MFLLFSAEKRIRLSALTDLCLRSQKKHLRALPEGTDRRECRSGDVFREAKAVRGISARKKPGGPEGPSGKTLSKKK